MRSVRKSLRRIHETAHRFRGFEYVVHSDGFHASVIDRTFSEQARAACNIVPHDASPWSNRPGNFRVSRAKDRDCGNSQCCRHVHRPGIVRDHHRCKRQYSEERFQIRSTRKRHGRVLHACANTVSDRSFPQPNPPPRFEAGTLRQSDRPPVQSGPRASAWRNQRLLPDSERASRPADPGLRI